MQRPSPSQRREYDPSRANNQIGSAMLHLLAVFLIGPAYLSTVWFATIAAYGAFTELEHTHE